MDEISKFFKGLYYQFLLRDIAAKVIPGLLTLAALVVLIEPDMDSLEMIGVPFIASSSLVMIVVTWGLGLMIGMLLQFLGARTYTFVKRNVKWGPRTFTIRGQSFTIRQIKFSLPAIDWTPMVLHVWGSKEETMKKELAFRHYANLDYIRMKRDRLVVFKEMAGNYAMAFSVAFISSLVVLIVYLFEGDAEFGNVLLTAILWAFALILSRQNKALAEEQRQWEKLIISTKGAPPVARTAQAAKPAARKPKS